MKNATTETGANQTVVAWEIDKIIPYDKNAKIHDDDQIEKLTHLIKRYGWTQPIVVDKDGVIIAGHGRRLAAIKMGFTKVPVICRGDLSKDEADALRLADNHATSQLYDEDKVRAEITRLAETDELSAFDFGLGEREFEMIAGDVDEIDIDALTEDIITDVDSLAEQNAEETATVDKSQVPLSKAFGFKSVSNEQARAVGVFMSHIEDEMGVKGADALAAFIGELTAPADV